MIYRFGTSELDIDRHRLCTDGVEVHAEPQAFALLALFGRGLPIWSAMTI